MVISGTWRIGHTACIKGQWSCGLDIVIAGKITFMGQIYRSLLEAYIVGLCAYLGWRRWVDEEAQVKVEYEMKTVTCLFTAYHFWYRCLTAPNQRGEAAYKGSASAVHPPDLRGLLGGLLCCSLPARRQSATHEPIPSHWCLHRGCRVKVYFVLLLA